MRKFLNKNPSNKIEISSPKDTKKTEETIIKFGKYQSIVIGIKKEIASLEGFFGKTEKFFSGVQKLDQEIMTKEQTLNSLENLLTEKQTESAREKIQTEKEKCILELISLYPQLIQNMTLIIAKWAKETPFKYAKPSLKSFGEFHGKSIVVTKYSVNDKIIQEPEINQLLSKISHQVQEVLSEIRESAIALRESVTKEAAVQESGDVFKYAQKVFDLFARCKRFYELCETLRKQKDEEIVKITNEELVKLGTGNSFFEQMPLEVLAKIFAEVDAKNFHKISSINHISHNFLKFPRYFKNLLQLSKNPSYRFQAIQKLAEYPFYAERHKSLSTEDCEVLIDILLLCEKEELNAIVNKQKDNGLKNMLLIIDKILQTEYGKKPEVQLKVTQFFKNYVSNIIESDMKLSRILQYSYIHHNFPEGSEATKVEAETQKIVIQNLIEAKKKAPTENMTVLDGQTELSFRYLQQDLAIFIKENKDNSIQEILNSLKKNIDMWVERSRIWADTDEIPQLSGSHP